MLHHFFEYHAFGETKVHLHDDNRTGQNKNRFMIYYLMWRVMTGLHKEIKLSFLLVGHTKFAPDISVLVFLNHSKKTRVGTINDIAEVAEKSAVVNHAQLIGDYDGSIYVPMYNWAEFFEDHTIQTTLKGISQMHHFRFTYCCSSRCGICKECL